jgi:hypothetical protein
MLAVFIAGLIVGLGFSAGLGGEFTAGLIILGVLFGRLGVQPRPKAG